jgi:hypothetical protein
MTLHRLPNSGLELDLAPGKTLTPEQEAVLDAYLPIVVRHEQERRAAQTPRERASERQAWLAAAQQGTRGRG